MSRRVDHVIVVGRDAPLWLSASVLQTALASSGVKVVAVELPSLVKAELDVYPTLPALEAFHNLLGIDESALLRATRGVFSLGQRFVDVSSATPSFFHAYGSYGAAINGNPFFSYWAKARGLGLGVAFEDFSLTAAAAKHGRMLIPDAATETYGRTDYGYHLPAAEYVAFLKKLAMRRGVIAHAASAVDAILDSERGDVLALDLGEGRRIEGDLFVDASGAEARLIGAALGVKFETWRAHFFADRCLAASGARLRSIPSYAEIRVHPEGWIALHPSLARTHVMGVHSSAICRDEDALARAATVSNVSLSDVVVVAFEPGRRIAPWKGNCVAVGEAACVFDPIHSVGLQALQVGLVHLLGLFPITGETAAEEKEYNRATRSAFERIRDFQSAFYALNRYDQSIFWSQAREAMISPDLAHKIDTFRARGQISPFEDETFEPDSWLSLFVGCGVAPDSLDPGIDRTPPEFVKSEFRRILGFIKDRVEAQATHDAYLASISARPPE